jgi:hypothetical protein
VIKLSATHNRKTNTRSPRAVFQPRRIIRANRLNRPKRNVRLAGSLISNNRYTAIAITQKAGLINRDKFDSLGKSSVIYYNSAKIDLWFFLG